VKTLDFLGRVEDFLTAEVVFFVLPPLCFSPVISATLQTRFATSFLNLKRFPSSKS